MDEFTGYNFDELGIKPPEETAGDVTTKPKAAPMQEPSSAPVRRRRRKKKKHLPWYFRLPAKIYLAAAAILLVIILLIVAIAKSCSADPGEGITASAFQTGTEINLPLAAELNSSDFTSYGGYQFQTSKSLSKMEKLIKKNNDGVTYEEYSNAYGTCAVFTMESESGTDSWCLYQADPANTSDTYIFMGMHRAVTIKGSDYDMLLPLQYVSDSYLRDTMGSRISVDTEYACGADKLADGETLASSFQSFYEASGLYTVSSAENGFTIIPKADPTLDFTLTFDETDGSGFFTVTSTRALEPEASENVTATETGGTTVTLPEQDALILSEILVNASYEKIAAENQLALEPLYTFEVDGEEYSADPVWTGTTWSVALFHDGLNEQVQIPAVQSCQIMAILAVDGVRTMNQSEAALPEDAGTLATAAMAMVASSDINARSLPVSGEVLSVLPEGTAVAVTGLTENNWYQICYGSDYAYVSGEYLAASAE